jgi:hypothetical protein
MRHLLFCAVLYTLSAAAGYTRSNGSADQSSRSILTVVLEFRGRHAARSMEEMEHEVENILRGAGRAVEWRSREEVGQGVFDELALRRIIREELKSSAA